MSAHVLSNIIKRFELKKYMQNVGFAEHFYAFREWV